MLQGTKKSKRQKRERAGGKIKVFGILEQGVKSTRRLFQAVAGRYYKTSSKQR